MPTRHLATGSKNGWIRITPPGSFIAYDGNLLVKKPNIEICLVGEANVLRKENDTISNNIILNIFEITEQKKLSVKKTSLDDTKYSLPPSTCDKNLLTSLLAIVSKKNYGNFQLKKCMEDNQ